MKTLDFRGGIKYFDYKSGRGLSVKSLRDWKILLLSFTVLIIVFLLSDIYLFWKYQMEMNAAVDLRAVDDEKAIAVDRQSLMNVLKELDRKAARFEENLSVPEIKDPSL